jgi:polyisoprenyl-teichoic acid--peptidoglycan teichoic acid transferase
MVEKKLGFLNRIGIAKRPAVGQFIWMGVGLVMAVGLFIFSRGFVSCWRLTALAGIPPSSCVAQTSTAAITNPGDTPVAGETATPTISAPQVELPPPWDGASRVTILVIGLDFRDWEAGAGAPRSDTMMLLTIDPVTKTAGMLSIPRDMWVNIPGFGYSKINNAYADGEAYHLPGGGPGLAMKTVENLLGIPITYFVEVSFDSFTKMIDTIGGIDIVITEDIVVDPIGPGNTKIMHPGEDHFSGALALGYARNRHTANGDVDRAARQQQVIMAIRDKVLEPGNFVNLMGQAPTLYNELSGGINTNLGLNDAMRLAVLAKDIPLESIQRGVIDYTMMQDGFTTLDGTQTAILRPYPDKIRELVDKIFGSGTMKPMASGSVEDNMKSEAARVLVINGSGIAGMAATTADYLKSQGMNITGYGNTTDYPDKYYYPFPNRTIIIVHSGKPYAMQYLTSLLQFSSASQIIMDFDPNAAADIVVALGYDFSGPP